MWAWACINEGVVTQAAHPLGLAEYLVFSSEREIADMANGKQDVLTEQDLTRINTALGQLDRAKTVIDLANQAGLDVKALDDRQRSSRDQLLRIKNTFFPGR